MRRALAYAFFIRHEEPTVNPSDSRAALAPDPCARKNARVAKLCVIRFALLLCSFVLISIAVGCTSPAQDVAQKIETKADETCKAGNEAACHTIVQVLGPTKVAFESTLLVDQLRQDCTDGKHIACEQLAVKHAELSSWCSTGNTRACAEVDADAWPHGWDEPALLDEARVGCIQGKFQKNSDTCQALSTL